VSGPQIALAWVLGKPYVTSPIIGATRMQHLDEALAALDIRLAADEVKALEEPYQLHPILGHS
jgi:aryl-alcohol dehydrogenase (NADP+)